MRRRGIALLVAVLAASFAGAGEPHEPMSVEAILAAINARRASHSLPPLRDDFRLREAAEDRISDMIELAYWSHESPDGRSPFSWLSLRGYRFARAGENLAYGFQTPEILVDSWMESPGHRGNILEPGYVDAGVAIIEGSTTGRAPGHSIVMLFGRELIEPITRRASKDQSRETSEPDRR
ncbi:MAG TPA: CAP domain-containing protein [Thermoanaerobaculia bacterium]|nr:CAP domain-containing protein [Thermoanaerobaculia bacterium]